MSMPTRSAQDTTNAPGSLPAARTGRPAAGARRRRPRAPLRRAVLFAAAAAAGACASAPPPAPAAVPPRTAAAAPVDATAQLERALRERIARERAEVAVAFTDL